MTSDYHIHLNFLPAAGPLPTFRVYRKDRSAQDARESNDTMSYSLPVNRGEPNRQSYWVTVAPTDGFEEFAVNPQDNQHLTRRAIFHALCESARQHLQPEQFDIPGHGFYEELCLVMQEHSEGQELLVIQPYFLRVAEQFGCLVDFHFRLRAGVPFSRRIQQLSLSLDKGFRRNLDYYLDRTTKITAYLDQRRHLLDSLQLPGAAQAIQMDREFVSLPGNRLRSKIYLCGGGRDSRSQFNGLQQFGPLRSVQTPPTLLFVFRERDRQAARTLAMALRGSGQRERYSFPGFKALFKTEITIDGNPIVLSDLSKESFALALDRVKQDRALNEGVIPVVVLPDGDDNGYMSHKAAFAHAGIPSQVCTLPVIQDDNALKWAIANIALQVFCKAGGQPWKVRPTPERALIIGISQSHKIREVDGIPRVDKYFAFSVMTDNSGLFQRLQVLGDASNQPEYLDQLTTNLREILTEGAEAFSRVVVHTSFRLKNREMDAIQKTVDEAAGVNADKCRFAVVKINHKTRFFGVNRRVNSLVPYEATAVRLGGGEYLVWFEGIFPDRPTVSKLFPGPTHIHFLRMNSGGGVTDDVLLQDLVNLSGANWRGFNAKSAPVSVFYCHLVADLVHDFQERGLPLPQVQDLRPWFL
jgi:hypothetical protein